MSTKISTPNPYRPVQRSSTAAARRGETAAQLKQAAPASQGWTPAKSKVTARATPTTATPRRAQDSFQAPAPRAATNASAAGNVSNARAIGPSSAPKAPSFADQVKGQAPQKQTDLDLMLMADDCYKLPGQGETHTAELAKDGWTRLKTDANGQLLDNQGRPTGIDAKSLEDPKSGLRAAVFQNDKGQTVVAYAGTDTKQFGDIKTDLSQGLGFESKQYQQAQALALKAEKAFGSNVVFTGHSLGGGLASAAALATGNPAVTYNAAGLSDETIRALGKSPYEARQQADAGQIRAYQVDGDPLTGVQDDVPGLNAIPDALGHELNLKGPKVGPGLPDVTKAHFQDVIIDGLRNQIPTEEPSLEGNLPSYLEESKERVAEGVLDLAGKAAREVVGLGGDVAKVGQDFAGDVAKVAKEDFAKGKVLEGTAELVGDAVEGGLNLAGDVIERGSNVVGRAVEDVGQVAAQNLSQLGELVGAPGAGQAVANVVDKTTEAIGHGVEVVGDGVKSVTTTVGNAVEKGADVVGKVGQTAVDTAKKVGSWLNPFD
jgi:hypothetical protein